jgi:predicted enzyme related to lactoylglutathione lyase
MVVAHFIVSDDVERSRRFYTEVLGGKAVIPGEATDEVTYVALANSWIIINVGGGLMKTSRQSRLRRRPIQIV